MPGIKMLFNTVDKALVLIIKPVVVIISASVAIMLSIGIFTRAVLDRPIFGLEELILMGAMWLYMLGAVLACRDRSHLTADFVQVLTSNRKIVLSMHLVATCISLFMAIMFSIWSSELFIWGLEKEQTTPVFQLPWYISQGSLFFASVIFIFYLVRDFFNDLTSFLEINNHSSQEL